MTRVNRCANIISPHRDDAALSLTCTLHDLIGHQIDVRILSCFTVSSWAPTMPKNSSFDRINVLREQEDIQFARFIGRCKLESLGSVDAPLRSDWIVTDGILQPPDSATKEPLINELQRKLSAYKQPGCAWFVPMAHSHRDHFLARAAGLKAAGSDPICIYEDIPYSFEVQDADASRTISMLEDSLGCELGSRTLHRVFDREMWVAAMRHYASQFTEAELGLMCEKLAARGGERIWTTKSFDHWMGEVSHSSFDSQLVGTS